MDFVSNILKKTPFSSEDGGEKTTASDATTTDESIKGTSENESKKSGMLVVLFCVR